MKNSVRRGPARAATRSPLAPERARVLAVIADQGPVTVVQLAEVLGLHPNSVRLQLDALVHSGDVLRVPQPSTGRGRPAHAFVASPAGRSALADPGQSPLAGGLLPALVEHLASQPDGSQQALALGEAWGRRALASGPSAAEIKTLMERQGFAPEEREGDLVLRTCPLLDEAIRHPEIVCRLHAGLLEGSATLHPFSEEDGCRVVLISARGA